MNCLLSTPRFSALPPRTADSHLRTTFFSAQNALPLMSCGDRRIALKVTSGSASNDEICDGRHRRMAIKVSGSASSAEVSDSEGDLTAEKSEIYSNNMTEAMGGALIYKHEEGMNYNFIRPDLIVGSCPQNPDDVDKLRAIGVKTIFCLQQNPDLKYFNVDIELIQKYVRSYDDMEHVRAEIRDFDSHDMRIRLPDVISNLQKAVERNGGVTYVHCTAGLGRAPSVALAYMFWVLDYELNEAVNLLLSNRTCMPKVDAIKSATVDILSGLVKIPVLLSWKGGNCTKVEIAGLDIGWGQRTPLHYDQSQNVFKLEKELYEGRYEYKYIVDDHWTHNEHEPVAPPSKDGHINNYIEVFLEDESTGTSVRKRVFENNAELTTEEREKLKEFLKACGEEEEYE